MKINIYLFCLGLLLWAGTASAQEEIAPYMSYQAAARSIKGALMADESLEVKIAFSTKDGVSEIFYEEVHQTQTDEIGNFALLMGTGTPLIGEWAQIPWPKRNIFLNVYLRESNQSDFKLVSRSQMLSVPYAMHSKAARELSSTPKAGLRNQSIYWNTSGNDKSRPEVHYLGTRDAQDVVVKTNNTTRAIFTKEGQLEIYSGVTGEDDNPDAYPVTVEGSTQGVYIKVNGSRSNANNFLTFADDIQVWGRVEGETLEELLASRVYQVQIDQFALKGTSLAAQIIAVGAEGAGLAATGIAAGGAVGALAEVAALSTEIAALATEADFFKNNAQDNVGVVYNSGNGDYAEYLKRRPGERDLMPGEIVGIKAGRVGLGTTAVDHYRVISSAPIVLGNAPQPDQEHLFEKVAFMGQVPVRVSGEVKAGEYIIPSGNNDGLGVALSPEEMKLGDYNRIIGIAWESASFAPINLINVAIGINGTDMGKKMEALNAKVDRIHAYLKNETSMADVKGEEGNDRTVFNNYTRMDKIIPDEAFDQLLDDNQVLLNDLFGQTTEILNQQGYDFSKNPKVKDFLDQPIPFLKKLRRNPNYVTEWALIDQKIKQNDD